MCKEFYANFGRKEVLERDKDGPDPLMVQFINRKDLNGNSLEDCLVKQTKLLSLIKFKRDILYKVKLHESNSYPVEVSWDTGRIFMEFNNRIISEDDKGNRTNHSESIISFLRTFK